MVLDAPEPVPSLFVSWLVLVTEIEQPPADHLMPDMLPEGQPVAMNAEVGHLFGEPSV